MSDLLGVGPYQVGVYMLEYLMRKLYGLPTHDSAELIAAKNYVPTVHCIETINRSIQVDNLSSEELQELSKGTYKRWLRQD